jgi:hypothetical protein
VEFPAEIDNIKTLKKGMKMTLAINDENVKEVMQYIYNFMDKPLKISLDINADEQKERLNQITVEQRKKIYAILNDFNQETGQGVESLKETMKKAIIMNDDYETSEMFSLSNCSKEIASEFIEFLIDFAFQHGIRLSDNPKSSFDNIESYLRLCIKNKVCAICGKHAEVHHVDTIGMGNNRDKLDDSSHRKIALCREHHSETHTIGWQSFKEKHHVKGVI